MARDTFANMPLSTTDADSATEHTSTRRATTRWGKEVPTVTISDLGRSYLLIQPHQQQLIEYGLGWLHTECRDFPRAKHILTESSDGKQIHTRTEVEMNYPLGEAVISDRDDLSSSIPTRQLTARIRVKTAGRSLPIDFKKELSDRVRLLLDSTGRVAKEQTDHFRVDESDGTKTIDPDGLPRFDAVTAHQWPDRHLIIRGALSGPTEEVYQVTFHDVCSAYVFDGVDTFNTVEINRTAVQCTEADVVFSLLVSDPFGESSLRHN